MEEKNWTYEQLAGFLGTTKSTAHDWANGAGDPHVATLRKIAKKFDVEPAELI